MKNAGLETFEYKGYYIDHFPYSWKNANGDIIKSVDAWIILSPNYLVCDNGEKIYMPLYTHYEDNSKADFNSLDEAKDYIDKYMVNNRGKYIMMNRDECHYIIKPTTESLLNEVYPHKGESKKDFTARFMSATKDEYPDIKQRYAVCMSYWDRKNKKNKIKESEGIVKMKAIRLIEANLNYSEQVAKMQAFENGSRGFNAKAASDEKLRYNRNVCHNEGFSKALRAVEDEMISRGMLTIASSYTYGNGQQQAQSQPIQQAQPTPPPQQVSQQPIPTLFIDIIDADKNAKEALDMLANTAKVRDDCKMALVRLYNKVLRDAGIDARADRTINGTYRIAKDNRTNVKEYSDNEFVKALLADLKEYGSQKDLWPQIAAILKSMDQYFSDGEKSKLAALKIK